MKNFILTHKFLLLFVCLLSMGSFSLCSCDDDEDETREHTGKEVILFMQKKLYDKDGEIALNWLDTYKDGEYNLVADEESDVYDFFKALTGIKIDYKGGSYQEIYEAEDGIWCRIKIQGTRKPQQGIYATIRFEVPDCPDIRVLHLVIPAVMEGVNGNMTGAVEHDFPHQVKGMI